MVIAVPRPGRILDTINSRLRSPDIDLETITEVLSRYGLRLTASPRNLTNTRRNWNLIVRTPAGIRILKRYRPDWRTSTIAFEHSVLGRLAETGFPAPRLVGTMAGYTWVNVASDSYCIFEFINGRNYSSSFLIRPHRVRMMRTAGTTLARLHKELAGFLPEGEHHIGYADYTGDRHRDMAWHERKVRRLSDRSEGLSVQEDCAHARWLVRHADQLLEEMANLDDRLRQAPLPRIIIHGDYGLHNLIYQGLGSAVPVDFELSRLEWRLSDLVSVVSKFRYKDGSYDSESINGFLHAYQVEFSIPEDEWRHFPLVWKFYKLMKAVQYWSSYFETDGPARKLISARDEIERAPWALEHPRRVEGFRGDI